MTEATVRYVTPGWFTRNVFNRSVAFLTRNGVSVAGTRILTVTGRKSGQPRTTVVNVLDIDGQRYLVSPRGRTEWVRNIRVEPTATVAVGRRREQVVASELGDDDKLPVLRAYLDKWKWEVGQFFEGLDPDGGDEAARQIAPGFPVFKLEPAA